MDPVTGLYGTVGVKPPWNQPHVRPALLSRFPMFSGALAPLVGVIASVVVGWSSRRMSGRRRLSLVR